MLTTVVSSALIIAGTATDYSMCSAHAEGNEVKFKSVVLSLGTFMFGFGGHAVFPTIQHDMRKPRQFTRSAIFAFAGKDYFQTVFQLLPKNHL